MLKKIAQKSLLLQCAQALRRKNFRPGFDGMTAKSAILWLEINGDAFCRRLLRGAYDPMPATTFQIAKQDGSYRQLAKLSALDMVIQNAILQEAVPFFEAHFSEYSHAYRPNRSVKTAISQFCTLGTQFSYAAKIDPKACYDHFDHAILEAQLTAALQDTSLVSLIMKYVRMPVISDGEVANREKGILQGAPLSNLLCNIYLASLDDYLQSHGIPFIRYADDVVIFAPTLEEINARHEKALRFLQEQLSLIPNSKKCKIDSPTNMQYLGFRFERSHYGLIALEANTADTDAYRHWQDNTPPNNHRRIDILRDGILRQKDFTATFDDGNQQNTFPVLSTDIINIYSSVIFDTKFLQRAMENGISIHIFDKHDNLVGRFIPSHSLHTPNVQHQQLLQYFDESARLSLAKKFVLASIHNCRLNIRYYNKQKPNAHYDTVLQQMSKLEQDIKNCKAYESLLLVEARAKSSYYSCFDHFIAESGFSFGSRTKRPPLNEVNAMISFGNVVLYSFLATAINKSPLDIRIGYLHATNRRSESLNLDLAEAYKPLLVDRVVFSLLNLKMMKDADFAKIDNGGVYLSDSGKRKFLRAFYSKLDTALTIRGQKISYDQIIMQDVQSLTRYFRHGERYVPFKQVK